jgi:hypothetical protein
MAARHIALMVYTKLVIGGQPILARPMPKWIESGGMVYIAPQLLA